MKTFKNSLSVFDHFMGLALNELIGMICLICTTNCMITWCKSCFPNKGIFFALVLGIVATLSF